LLPPLLKRLARNLRLNFVKANREEIITVANKIIVAAIQMDCTPYDKEKNLAHAEELVAEAATRGATLIVLPELFSTGYRVELKDRELAEELTGETVKRLQRLAEKHGVYIAGAILERGEKNSVYDTAVIVGADGLLGSQRKMHLWGDEVNRFEKGSSIGVVKLPSVTVGLLICYEIGFPEQSRIEVLKGAEILLYPSAFGKARYYAWDIASKSRALENGAFVVACNRCGQDSDSVFGGLSRIVAPDTTILASAGVDEERIVIAELDLSAVKKMRDTLPYLRDLNQRLHNQNF
jgi:predicted amidohydrolase